MINYDFTSLDEVHSRAPMPSPCPLCAAKNQMIRLEAENAALRKAKERVLSICRDEDDCYTWRDDFGHWVRVENIVTSLLCRCNEHFAHDEDCPSAAFLIAQTDERKAETE